MWYFRVSTSHGSHGNHGNVMEKNTCHGSHGNVMDFFFNLPKCHGNFIFWHVFTAVVENATFNGLKSKKFSLARNFLMKLNYYHIIFSFKLKI